MIRKLRKHFLKLFVAWVVLTTALAFFVLRSEFVADKVYNYTLAYLEENLQSKVEMGRPEVSWLRGSWYIKNVSIRPRYGKEKRELISAKSVRVSFLPWWNILNREIGISSVQLEDPAVYFRVEKGKIANLPSLDFLKGEKGIFKFTLREVRISNGKMAVNDPEKPMEILFGNTDMKIRPDVEKGQYGFTLANSAADIKFKDFTQKIRSLKGDFSITPEHLTVIKSTVKLPEGDISAEGLYLDFATTRWVASLSSTLDLSDFKKAVGARWSGVREATERVELKGKATISAIIEGDEKGFNATGGAKARAIELDGIKISDIASGFSARFKAGQKRIEINGLSAGLFGGSLKGKLDLDMEEGKGFTGKLHIGNMDIKELRSSLKSSTTLRTPPLNVRGKVSGDIDISGEITRGLKIEGSSGLQVRDLYISHDLFATKVPAARIKAQISYKGGATGIKSLLMETPSSAVSLSGDIAGKKLSLEIKVSSSELSELTGKVKGKGTLKGKVSGSVSEPEIDGSLDIRNVSWDKYHADGVSGNVTFKERTISSTGLIIKRGGSDILLKGEFSLAKETPRLDAVIELEKGRLEDLTSMAGIDLQGRGDISFKGKVNGAAAALDGEIEISGARMAVMGEEIDALNIEGRMEKGRFLLKRGEVSRDGERLTFAGDIDARGEVDMSLSSSPLLLKNFRFLKKGNPRLDGAIELKGQVAGNIKNPSFKGNGVLRGVGYRNIHFGNGDVGISVADRVLTASGNIFGAELNGTLMLRDNNPFSIGMNAKDLSLTPFFQSRVGFEGMTGSLSGSIEATGEISRLKDISAKAYISKLQMARDPFLLKNEKEIEIEFRDRKIILNSFQLSGRGTLLDASGWMETDGKANLLLTGNVDLFLLELFTGAIKKGAGVADVNLIISGKPPRAEGRVAIRDGVIGIKDFDHVFRDISGKIVLRGGALIIESVAGRVGEGRFKGEGTIEMAGLALKRTDINFDVTGLRLAYPRWLPSEVEGNLRLSGDYPSLLLSGDLHVIRAMYSERIDWATFLPSFKERMRKPETLKDGSGLLRVDINFKADRNLIFENNVGKGELKGEIRLKRDTAGLGVVGAVEVMTGKVFYKEHEFNINSGIIEFPDPKKVEPVFDFTAEGKVRDYTIQILVQGNINDLKVTMTSFPPLSELDIASLLSIGLTTEEFQKRGGGAPVYGAASILSREVEARFKDYIGLDRFHIDPYYSKATGTSEPKLTVGKDLSDDILIIYSRSLSGTGEQETQMEYKLYKNFSLLGGWSSFGTTQQGDLGADVKFRYEFR